MKTIVILTFEPFSQLKQNLLCQHDVVAEFYIFSRWPPSWLPILNFPNLRMALCRPLRVLSSEQHLAFVFVDKYKTNFYHSSLLSLTGRIEHCYSPTHHVQISTGFLMKMALSKLLWFNQRFINNRYRKNINKLSSLQNQTLYIPYFFLKFKATRK